MFAVNALMRNPSYILLTFTLLSYIAVNALKSTNPELKVFLQVSGASMAVKLSTFGQREIFINSTIDYLRQYGFDGLDVSYTDPNSTVFKSLSEV